MPRFSPSCSFFFQAEDGIRDLTVTGVQTCALPISHKWFSTRQANLLDADAHRNARDAFDFFVGEYLRLLQPGQALGWHAVGAAKVALIGNRNAHAFNAASVAVNEQFHRSVSLSPG